MKTTIEMLKDSLVQVRLAHDFILATHRSVPLGPLRILTGEALSNAADLVNRVQGCLYLSSHAEKS